ncbi:hypothetical protein CSIRO_0590 [Bradyrhizobiaceae bacterium SG-6C]|nr:hypothetical protein CSIRO_0590 [Bradyrhizobiaceae bacterium SG-6C]
MNGHAARRDNGFAQLRGYRPTRVQAAPPDFPAFFWLAE